jgi:hypothetical protein
MATTTTKKPAAARKATAKKAPAARKATTAKKAPAKKATTGMKANCPLCGFKFAKPKYKCGNRKACESRQAEKRSRGRKVA